MTRFSLAAVLVLVCASSGGAGAQSSGTSCDRACLLGIADAYLAALTAHDPSKAPLAPNARFTEQAQPLKVGEGLWRTVTQGPTAFKLPVADPVAGQIGVIVMLRANMPRPPGPALTAVAPPPDPPGPAAVQLALRLKVENRQITEAEHIVARITSAEPTGQPADAAAGRCWLPCPPGSARRAT